ncbi:MAG: hypothetical protein AUK51_04155 [Comamonadaceae bacterium CG2_30_59_20]|nr:MAG: hypothetical protein AUK51_04155 [Comamonadaceae bacterium CG2_30_59_20]
MSTHDDQPVQPDPVTGPDGMSSLPFNPLTGDLQDLQDSHTACWLWPNLSPEISRLDDVITDARIFLTTLLQPEPPEWAMQAALGMSRSNHAIHQHAQRHNSYVTAARSLWTTRIPQGTTTLTDAQIYALLAIHESRMAAALYCEIAQGIEVEMALTGVGHDDVEDIAWLRTAMAGWERALWHDAAQQTGTAEKFLLMAQFAASQPGVEQLRQAESRMAELQRRAQAAEDGVKTYRKGRRPGAVGKFTKALEELIDQAKSNKVKDIMVLIEAACYGGPIAGIQFQDCNDYHVWYLDIETKVEGQIKIPNLQRRLNRFSDI